MPGSATREAISPYHGFIPNDRHPLLGAVGALRNQGEVVLPHSFLGSVEGTVSTASDLKVSTGRKHMTLGFLAGQHTSICLVRYFTGDVSPTTLTQTLQLAGQNDPG